MREGIPPKKDRPLENAEKVADLRKRVEALEQELEEMKKDLHEADRSSS